MNYPISNPAIGRSIGFDFPQASKTKLNNMKTVSIEDSSHPAAVWPAFLNANNNIKICHISAKDSKFKSQPPIRCQ